MNKLIFIDTETTGKRYYKDGLIQLAGKIIVGNNVDEFNYYFKPFEDKEIQEEALKVLDLTPEEIWSRSDPIFAYNEFIKLLNSYIDRYNKYDKFFVFGYKVEFDMDFLRQWFKDCDEENGKYYGSYFWYPYIDVMSIAGLSLINERKEMKNFKQSTVAHKFGIEINEDEQYHDAMTDVNVCHKILNNSITKLLEN